MSSLADQIRSAQRSIASWPKWMRDAVYRKGEAMTEQSEAPEHECFFTDAPDGVVYCVQCLANERDALKSRHKEAVELLREVRDEIRYAEYPRLADEIDALLAKEDGERHE